MVRSDRQVPDGPATLGFRMRREGSRGVGTLTIDGAPCGSFETDRIFVVTISWSGLDVGRDRASPVSDYDAPFEFTGRIRRVVIDLDDDQELDHAAVGDAERARE